MPRRDALDPKIFEGQVAACFARDRTSYTERVQVACQWCEFDYLSYVDLALRRDLLPIALIVGALVDIEHPYLVVGGRLVAKSMVGCAALVLRAEYVRLPVHIPAVNGLGTDSVQVAFVRNPALRIVEPA